jgi:hypothetical protein
MQYRNLKRKLCQFYIYTAYHHSEFYLFYKTLGNIREGISHKMRLQFKVNIIQYAQIKIRCLSGSLVGLPKNSYKPMRRKLQKGCIRLAAASDKVYQLLPRGQWFSPDTPASSTTTTDCHDIAEILLKVALKRQKSNKSINLIKIY